MNADEAIASFVTARWVQDRELRGKIYVTQTPRNFVIWLQWEGAEREQLAERSELADALSRASWEVLERVRDYEKEFHRREYLKNQ